MSFNLSEVNEAVSAEIRNRDAVVMGDRRTTYGELVDDSRRFASALVSRGLGCRTEREELAGHESGQDHLAIYLHNGPEYLIAMLGAFKARVAPFNVNFRYVGAELDYLFGDADPQALVFHARFAPNVVALSDARPEMLLIQVPDDSGQDLLPGAVSYDDFLASGSPDPLDVLCSPDDLYILYTGGTTGMPKGVLWRQTDIFVSAMGGRQVSSETTGSLEDMVEAARSGGRTMLVVAPLMHGAAQWATFSILNGGGTIHFPSDPLHLDPLAIWTTIASEKILAMLIVGDAMARPLIDELDNNTFDLSGFIALASGGALFHTSLKERFLEHVPHGIVMDAVGSSETGAQMGHVSARGAASTGTFDPGPFTVVISSEMSRVLERGADEQGWLAQRAHVPLGYLGDRAKTAVTFPVIDGVRYAVPGDRAVWRTDGVIDLLGRDSVTINSGGEKIFAEEVEQALVNHPAVYDVIVVGRPSERWGSEVVAVVQLADDMTATDDDLAAVAAEHIASYKLPKAFIYRDALQRSPAGKADYRWAAEQALTDR